MSVELDEIFALSDRIAVMFDGKIMGVRDAGETDQRELGLLMAGITEDPGGDEYEAVDAAMDEKDHREAARHG